MTAAVVLRLGSISFDQFEVTSAVQFGGSQRLAVHRLAGGGRVVDILGRDEGEISFSGFFAGLEATSRARQLDFLRASGTTLPLSWDVFYYSVVIRDLSADYTNAFWIPFRVRCTVIRDEAAPVSQYSPSAITTIEADAASAVSLAVQAGLQLGLPSTGVPSVSLLQSAQSQLTNACASLQQGWEFGSLDTVSTAAEGISSLQTASNATGNLARIILSTSYIGRAVQNATSTGQV